VACVDCTHNLEICPGRAMPRWNNLLLVRSNIKVKNEKLCYGSRVI
jgi:hypothetical protein